MEEESAVLGFDFWSERGREGAVVCDRENQIMDIKQMALYICRREQRDELGWNSDGGLFGRCDRTSRPFSGNGV